MESRYELREKIGQGGIGSVHRAYDKKMRRDVAIKRILTSTEDLSLESEATKQLMAEVGALASLQHPHIVTVFDVGEDDLGPYIVMELIQGKTLDEIIESAPLVWHDFRIVAMQSLEALIAAQELDMIHSDLKPPNIMLTWLPSGAFQVKIVDFGLAVLVQNQSQEEIESMEAIYGSIFFMPPEQYERKTLDTRSDLYSLGCCFYQALTGTYPFNGGTGMEVMMSHLNHTVRPLQEIRADIPLWACHWVMWLINRFPDDRPLSAREALANFLQNDKETNPIMSRGGGAVAHPRLIIPASIPGGTGPVTTSPDKATARTSFVQTPGPGLPTTTHAVEAQSAAPPRKVSRKTLVIAISSAAALLLIGGTAIAISRYNGKSGEREYKKIAAMAGRDDVREVLINSTQLRSVLDFVSQSRPDAYLSPAYTSLTKAKPSDGTNFDQMIVEFATSASLPAEIRLKLFQEVVQKRATTAYVPAIIKFCVTSKDAACSLAAYQSVRRVVREEHVEGLVGIIASPNANDKVKQVVDSQIADMIAITPNKPDFAKAISKVIQETGNSPFRKDLERLLSLCTSVAKSPPKPNPAPAKPNPAPTPAPPATTTPQVAAPPAAAPGSFLESFAKMDQAAKLQTIATLSKSTKIPEAHHQLLDIYIAHSDLKEQSMKALIELNSNPDILQGEAPQRWLQMIWKSNTLDTKKALIDGLSKINTAWSKNHLQQMSLSPDAKANEYAKKVLSSLP